MGFESLVLYQPKGVLSARRVGNRTRSVAETRTLAGVSRSSRPRSFTPWNRSAGGDGLHAIKVSFLAYHGTCFSDPARRPPAGVRQLHGLGVDTVGASCRCDPRVDDVPHGAPVCWLDEVKAAKDLVLRYALGCGG